MIYHFFFKRETFFVLPQANSVWKAGYSCVNRSSKHFDTSYFVHPKIR